MYIVYETNDAINTLRSKYLVLELDTVEFSDGATLRAFAVIDSEHIPFEEVTGLPTLTETHEMLIQNYREQNWQYCKEATEYLRGSFKGEMDTFYDEIEKRISILETTTLADDWTGNIISKHSPASA